MHYQEIAPHTLLARHVRCYWILEDPEPRDDRPAERIVPDGCMELIFNLADLFARSLDGRMQHGLRTYLIGEVERHVIAYPSRRVHLFGIRFHPGGLHPFLRSPVSELAGSVLDLEDVWSGFARELEERMHDARSTAERVTVVESALFAKLDPDADRDRLLDAARSAIERGSGMVRIASLAADLGISARQLERRFRAAVGVTPKAYSRVVRFQRIIRAVEQSRDAGRWVERALDAGYADQAHFINDFRAFAGESPARFFAGYHQMSDHFSGLATDSSH